MENGFAGLFVALLCRLHGSCEIVAAKLISLPAGAKGNSELNLGGVRDGHDGEI